MALPSNYRFISVGKLKIRNRTDAPHYAPDFVIGDLIEALGDRIKRNDMYRDYSKDSRRMWCAQFDEDNGYHRLILEVGDKNVSGVSFVNFQTRQTRDIAKGKDEGSHYAAHILIKQAADQDGKHLILIEKVPGIYFASIKDHFAWVCNNDLYKKAAQDNNGNPKRFRAIFEIDGHQSRTIREALMTGTLQDIEFIGYGEKNEHGLDEDLIVKEIIHEAKWEVKKRVSEDQARSVFGRISGFLDRFRHDVDRPQIFVRIKADNGQIKRTEVHHNGNEILEQAFVQNEIVSDFDPPLTQRYKAFRQDMIQKMLAVAKSVDD